MSGVLSMFDGLLDRVTGRSAQNEEIGRQIAQLPAVGRQADQLLQILTQYGRDTASQGSNATNFDQVVNGFDQLREADELLRELDSIAREGLARAMEAGEIRQVGEDQYDLGLLPLLGVVARVGAIIAKFLTSAQVAAWAAKWLRLTAIIAAVQIIASSIANLVRAGGTAVHDVGTGLQAATTPLLLVGALYLLSKLKRRGAA